MLNVIKYLRRKQLKHKGLKVGPNCYIANSVIFDYTFPHLISVGENTTIAGNVIILAHDASMKRLIGYTKLGRVSIGNNCFIGERTLILPNVAIGDNSVVGAGSVVVRDIPENSVACGNPARVLKSTSVFVEKHKQEMKIIDRKDGVSYVL